MCCKLLPSSGFWLNYHKRLPIEIVQSEEEREGQGAAGVALENTRCTTSRMAAQKDTEVASLPRRQQEGAGLESDRRGRVSASAAPYRQGPVCRVVR